MSHRIVKSLGPPMAVLTVVAWLSWGHLAPPLQLESPRPKLPTLNPQRMEPDLSDRYTRDPFRTTAVATKADKVKKSELEDHRAYLRAERRQRQALLSDQVNQLVLNGAVLGNRPQAIINQRIFQVGDLITLTDSDVPLRVARIGRDWVQLDSELIHAKLMYGEPVQITRVDDPALLGPAGTPSQSSPDAQPDTNNNWWKQLKNAVRNVSAEGDG